MVVFVHLCWLSLGVCREIKCIGSERETLLKLKHHLKDPSNRLSSWNATANSNCCQWDGVVCNNITSHTAELHLNTPFPTFHGYEVYEKVYEEYTRRAFGGEINPCLVDLKHLDYLDFSGNIFESTPIPSFIATITSLTYLNLSRAGFTGNIPPHFGNLSNLLYLDLSRNELLGGGMPIPYFVGRMTTLIHLDLSYSGFMGNIPPQIGNLSNLAYLGLRYVANGTIPSQIGNLSNLLYLELRTLFLFTENWVFEQKKLVSLTLFFNNINGPIPDGLRNLTLLENLDLRRNSFSSSIPDWFYDSLPHLKFLDLSFNILQGTIPHILGNMTSLITLDLSANQLEGPIPTSLGFENIIEMDFSENKIGGELPRSLGKLSSLRYLILFSNQLSGNPFESLRSLSKLSLLDIADNCFQGVVKEGHLENLTNLSKFYAPRNNLTLKVSPNWHPTFRLTDLDMSSWQLGPNFPSWTHSQNDLQNLVMSNTRISDSIPSYFWEAFSFLQYLNLSNNHIHGKIENSLTNPISFSVIDLSSNHFHGKLPFLSNQVIWLDLSSNSFSSMNDFLCCKQFKKFNLYLLNLASNNISGKIPDCWIKWSNLMDVNLQSNHFVGNMPLSMGSLAWLESLNIRNNSLLGIFSTALKKNNQLISLDLGENNLSGTIPTWIGERLLRLKILRLRSNNFSGHIPNEICDMIFLQDLDLAQNSLFGNIPNCFNHFNAIIIIWTKGRASMYNTILGLVTNVDLSDNNLSGEIPREITDLDGLIYLNLSKNQLSGRIPQSIDNMRLLESIDISRNQISGEIPPTISKLCFLNHLDLSYNHLKGKIPIGTQIQSFEASGFIGNHLCGAPLLINCGSHQQISYINSFGPENDKHGVNWFF
ncbi:hypothetical protein PHAVU_004G116600, partial [Phaseolus vulgaris]